MKVILEMCCAHEIRYLCFYFKGIIMISQVDYSYKLAVKKLLIIGIMMIIEKSITLYTGSEAEFSYKDKTSLFMRL